MLDKYVEEMSRQEMSAYEAHLRDYLRYLRKEQEKVLFKLEIIKREKGKPIES